MEAQGAIPHLLFMAFQGTFAIITAALISGAVVERMRFNAYLAFIVLWVLVVYAPVAHWVWGGGFLATMGALDFAGGAVVHVNAAAAALVAALVVGPAQGLRTPRDAAAQRAVHDARAPGCCGSAGSGSTPAARLAAGPTAALAFANTLLAPAATLATWTLIDSLRGGPRDRGRRRHGHRRRPGRRHAGGRLHRARLGARDGRARAPCRATSP